MEETEKPKITKYQKKVIEYGEGSLLVEAGPGSGKTFVIVERIKHLIKTKEKVDPKSFLVITFTNKAADNLKFKLRKELPNEFVSKMQISTIHSFCLEFLKSRDVPITLIDDETSERKTLFIKQNKKRLGFKGYSTIYDYHIPAIINKFSEYTSFNVDYDKLAENISASREISQDYKDFVDSMDYFNKKLIDDYDEQVKDDDGELLKDKIKKIKDELKLAQEELPEESCEEEGEIPEELKERIEELEQKIKVLENKKFSKSWYNARFLQIIEAYKCYKCLLDKKHFADYDTLQLKTYEELKKNPETNFKVIFVDEFQDTDPLQFRIFQELRKNCDYFTAVGDVDQHIYAFRSSFDDFFDKLFHKEKLKPLALCENFRSTEDIVNLTEAFIKPQRKESSGKEMRSNNKEYSNHNLIIKTPNDDEKKIINAIKAKKAKKEKLFELEAQKIFEIIKYLKENDLIKEFSDVAVLYRKHSDKTITNLVRLFKENGINFSIKGRRDLSEQSEVKSIITLMWYIARNTSVGYIPSKDELKDLNLKAFCVDDSEASLFSLDDSTKEYLCKIQDSYYADVIKNENKLFIKEELKVATTKSSIKSLQKTIEKLENKYSEKQVSGVRGDREDFATINEIFKDLQMPIIDIGEITNPKDKEFFEKLELIRENTLADEKPTILEVFYQLIGLSNIFDKVLDHKEIANLAILTQTISNYESFIYETDYRGVFFFLKDVIKNYDAYQEEWDGVQLMTIHSAKGLEFPVTFISSLQKGQFPMISDKDSSKEDHIFPNDTYYTPNEFLKYKTIFKEDENGVWNEKTISIEEERQFEIDELSEVVIKKEPEHEQKPVDEIESLEEPLVLNYSKYTQYLSCPFKYDLSYNLGFVRSGSAKAANRGSVFHEIMEKLNQKLIKGETVSKEKLEYITTEHYKSMFDIEENKDEFEEFKKKVEEYYYKYSLNREVLAAEFDFELYIDDNLLKKYEDLLKEYGFDLKKPHIDFILNGAIDLIYKVSEDEIVILDYKYAEFDENHIGAYEKQSIIYALALNEIPDFKEEGKIKKAIIHFVKDDKQYEVEINERKIGKELAKICEVAKEIHDVTGGFDKAPEKEEDCARCSYRTFCKPEKFAHELYE